LSRTNCVAGGKRGEGRGKRGLAAAISELRHGWDDRLVGRQGRPLASDGLFGFEGWECDGVRGLLFLLLILGPLVHEDFFEVSPAIVAFGEVFRQGDEAEFGVLFDVGCGFRSVYGVFLLGEIEAGDLDAVE
jgi:hypothetical protein